MKLYVISDNIDTLTGMRLAGIEGCVAHTHDEVVEAMAAVQYDKDLAILLFTQKAASYAPDEISDLKLNHSLPLVVNIPDRHGLDKSQNVITDYIRDAIGLKI